MIDSYRLPRFALPRSYELEIEPELDEARFTGQVSIVVDVVEATPVLTLNAAELDITSARIETPEGTTAAGSVTLDVAEQQASIHFPDVLAVGDGYRLHLDFRGSINDQLHGFYRSTFRTDDGEEKIIATTQFEPSDARRAFPCWDEPEFKATFKINMVVDPALTVLSNSGEEKVELLDDGRRRVCFSETMVMSTYLVAFVVGPYELNDPSLVDGVPIRIVTVPGKSHLTGYAERVAVHALGFLAQYFEIPYPGSKLDHIAVPDFAFGAMENLGCATYRENVLLADVELASQLELQRVATVVAHETAHMWFGDLVTMKWWNGIWLNEAFATFMENTTTESFNPEWQVWTSFVVAKALALATDGLRATRPVEYQVGRPEEAEAMFDILTYQKGGAVLRMMEQYLGPETFRKGISHYLRTHAYGNTETADLWDAIEAVSGEPVRTIMNSWIFNAGHPLVMVDTTEDSASISLRQRRFFYNEQFYEAEEWSVPVTLRASVGGAVQRHRILLEGRSESFSFDGPIDWVVVNDGACGFYRVHYSPELLQRIHLGGILNLLDPLERLNLLVDTWATMVSGLGELADWARVAEAVCEEDDDPDVWAAVLPALTQLGLLADDTDTDALDALILRLAEGAWERLGWQPGVGETSRVTMTRARVLSALTSTRSPSPIKDEVSRRFNAFMAGTEILAPDLVGVMARVAVRAGGEETWLAVLDQYRKTTVPQDKLRYLYALTDTDDHRLLARILDMTLTDEVRSQDAPFVVALVMAQPGATRMGWEWTERHWAAIEQRFPSSLLVRVLEGATNVVDAELAEAVERFAASEQCQVTGPRLDQIIERMHINVELCGRLRGTLTEALRPEA